MVDWVSGFIEIDPSITTTPMYDTGHWMKLDPSGEVEQRRAGHLTHQGSFDSSLLVKSTSGLDLFLSGNPVKHIQGHNLYGPDDPIALYFDAGKVVRQALGLFPSPETFEMFTGPRFTRIDITRSYRFQNSRAANSWLRDIASFARTRHGGSVMSGGTVYFGKSSEYWSMKIYNKGEEIRSRKKGHQLHQGLQNHKQLLEWSEGVVRFEVTLKSKELQRLKIKSWSPRHVWQAYFDKIQWNQNAMQTQTNAITAAIEQNLPSRLKVAMKLWRQGEDLRALYSKSAFYRHRREISKATGVDIASKPALDTATTTTAELHLSGWDPEPLETFPHDINQAKLDYLGQ